MADTSLIIRISANADAFQKSLENIGSQTKSLEKQLASIAKISGIAFAGLLTSIGLAVNEFAKFDNSLRAVRTLLDDTSFGAKGLEEGFKEMRAEALKLGSTVPVDIDKVNKALFDTVSAGIDAGKAVEVVATASRLAVAGLTDVSVATDGITSALNAYGLSAEQAESVAAKFFAAQVKGKTTVEELSSGFGLVAASAQAAGVSLNELLGATAALTTAGVKTNAAYTGLKAAIANIAKPTKEAQEEAAKLGVQFDAAALRSKGLEQFLKDLTEAEGFTKDSVTQLFGSVEAQNAIFALTGKQAKGFADNVRVLGDEQKNVTQLTEAYNIQGASLSNQFQLLKGSVQTLLIQLGERFAPVIEKGIEILLKFTQILNNNPGLIDFAAKAIGMTTVVTGLITGISTAALVFLKLRKIMLASAAATRIMSIATKSLVGATGIGLLIIIVSELVANWETAWPKMQAIFETFVKNVQKLLSGFGKLFIGAFTGNFGVLKEGLTELKDTFSKGFEEIGQEFDKIDLAQKAKEKGDAQLGAQAEINQKLLEQQKLSTEQLAQQERDAEAIRIEERRARFEEFLASNEEFQALSQEQQSAFITANMEEFEKAGLDRSTAERKLAEDSLKLQISSNQRKLREQIKYGKAYAEINGAIQSTEVQGFKTGTGQLEQLSRSKNSTLKGIGKAAALSNIAIKSAEGAMSAYAGFATIPIVGIPLGIAAAAGLIAYGVERSANVLAAQQGGIATGGIPGRDSIPSLLTPGELVTPTQNFDEVVNAVSNARASRTSEETFESGSGNGTTSVIIGFDGDEASQVLTAKQIEDRSLGISREAS